MRSILYIDDDAGSCSLFKYYMEKYGFQIFCTKTIKDAKEVLGLCTIDLIISDVGMPGENGIDFYRWLKNSMKYTHIPFLFVSGHAMGFDETLVQHKDIFITKPIVFPELIDRINNMLNIG